MRRIRVNLMFEKDSDADTVWSALKNYAKTKELRNLTNEKSYIHYEDCHHDESPPRACELIEHYTN